MVSKQGETVESIDANIDETVTNMDDGQKLLRLKSIAVPHSMEQYLTAWPPDSQGSYCLLRP